MQATIFSVSEVNRAIKQFIEGTQTFKNIFIQGELSNITYLEYIRFTMYVKRNTPDKYYAVSLTKKIIFLKKFR